MTPQTHNLFDGIPAMPTEELFDTLLESNGFRIERIVSDGHATPPETWYDQKQDEWVLLISGGATLLFDGNVAPLVMKPGDHVLIPAGCRHRVEQTAAGEKTVWLAVHFDHTTHAPASAEAHHTTPHSESPPANSAGSADPDRPSAVPCVPPGNCSQIRCRTRRTEHSGFPRR